MSGGAAYREHHPKWYRRRVSVWWWLQSRRYTAFVLRELTSVFVAFFALILLWQIRAVAEGPEAYAQFQGQLASAPLLALHAIAFGFVVFHSITWFNLAPKAMVVRLRGHRVPDWAISGGNYAAWLFLSAALAFLMLRG